MSEHSEDDLKPLTLWFVGSVLFYFLARRYFVPPFSGSASVALLFGLVFVSLGLVAFHLARCSILLGIGLSALIIAFWLSMIMTIGTLGEEYRLVASLEAHPTAYTQEIAYSYRYGLVPVAAGTALSAAGYVLRRKRVTDPFRLWLLLITGLFLALYGASYLKSTLDSHGEALRFAAQGNVVGIEPSLSAVYAAYVHNGLAWIVAGFAFLAMLAIALRTDPENSTEKREDHAAT
jgi:hypothetical protein